MNNPYQNTSGKKRPTIYNNDSILEALRDLGGSVGKSVKRDVAGKIANDAFTSIVGNFPKSGELQSGKPESPEPQEQPREGVRPREWDRGSFMQAEQARVRQEIEAVRAELKALSQSVKAFNQEVEAAIAQAPVNPGIYHKNFFERLRSVLKMLRQQIDDSRTWLSVSTGRKKQKHYWGLYKKHGTKFGLSSERTMATQTG